LWQLPRSKNKTAADVVNKRILRLKNHKKMGKIFCIFTRGAWQLPQIDHFCHAFGMWQK